MSGRRILAIDPGSEQSAWLVLKAGRPALIGVTPTDAPMYAHGIAANDDLLASLRVGGLPNGMLGLGDVVVIETIEPRYGIQMGWSTLDTARWIGRFEEAARPVPVVLLKRSDILRHLGVVTSPRKGEARVSADSGVRQALIDRFGGQDAAVGLKASPGPLYGISKDVWAALAVGVTYADQEADR